MVGLMTSTAIGNTTPTLALCPSSPNCISSQASDNHFIEPFKFSDEAVAAFNALREILSQRGDTKIISSSESEIRVEFRTLLGFVDDGLFVLDKENKTIHVRSAARLGYWDLNKNRRRTEEIRQLFLVK